MLPPFLLVFFVFLHSLLSPPQLSGRPLTELQLTSNNVDSVDANASDTLMFLEEFFNSTNGSQWKNNNGWLSSSNYCNWYGVHCNSIGNVTSISLNANQLSGPIPSSIGSL